MAKDRQKIVGKIDGFSGGFLRGWVFDPSRPRRRLCVDVFAGPAFLGQTACGFHRPDLEVLGFGDGRHEFLFALGAGIDTSDLHVRVASAPHVILRADAAAPEDMPPRPAREGLEGYFAALLAGLQLGGEPERRPRSRHPRLTESTLRHGVPLSRFAIHVAQKFGYDIEDERTLQAFLRFYFETYSPYRAPYRVPLAPAETLYWTTPLARSTCRAAATFAPAPARASAFDRTYAWAVEDAARICVEDAWVDESLIASLQRHRHLLARRQDFPMSRFLARFSRQNAALDGLRWNDVADRQTLYAAVVLVAARSPHLLRLLPAKWKERLIEPDHSGDCLLAHVLTRALGYEPAFDAPAYLARLEGAPSNQAGSDPVPAVDEIVDIQLVGPFDRILGLGESCRRMARGIAACGYRAAFANYDIGNASPRDARNPTSDALRRARINVLHLNLEEIPEALAFSLSSLAGSYLVAVPYFELSATAGCHELGLDLVDEIWAPTRFLKDLFGARCEATHLMPLPTRAAVEPDRAGARAFVLEKVGRADPVTVFLSTADALSWIGRKHTIGVVDAFQAAFGHDEPVCLLLKTHNTAHMADPTQIAIWAEIVSRSEGDFRIVLMNETIGAQDYRALLTGVDCLVSLHRSEGLGLDILDAMTLGTAVVATAYSGNLDICDERTSWPVAFDLVPVGEGNYPFAEPWHRWAEPRLATAVAALRDVHARPDERTRRTENARRKVAEANDLESTAAKIGTRIREILASI